MVGNCRTFSVGHFVRVRATIGELHVRIFLRVIGTHLQIVVRYPFPHHFNPLINLKHRTVQIIHNGKTHIIPVVKAYGNPHTPMPVDNADGELQAVQNAAEHIK